MKTTFIALAVGLGFMAMLAAPAAAWGVGRDRTISLIICAVCLVLCAIFAGLS